MKRPHVMKAPLEIPERHRNGLWPCNGVEHLILNDAGIGYECCGCGRWIFLGRVVPEPPQAISQADGFPGNDEGDDDETESWGWGLASF